MTYEVYLVTCAVNGKGYIGYTSKGAQARLTAHLDNARWGRKYALADAIRAYGPEAFSVAVLEAGLSHDEACAAERRLIAERGTILPDGYNMTEGGDGVPLTPEQREAASAKKRGRFTEAQRAALANRPPVSDETRAKLSAIRKGKPKSAEWVAKIAAASTGRPKSPATRAAISAAKKGAPWSEARRAAQKRASS